MQEKAGVHLKPSQLRELGLDSGSVSNRGNAPELGGERLQARDLGADRVHTRAVEQAQLVKIGI
jgi:hypothetical protein